MNEENEGWRRYMWSVGDGGQRTNEVVEDTVLHS